MAEAAADAASEAEVQPVVLVASQPRLDLLSEELLQLLLADYLASRDLLPVRLVSRRLHKAVHDCCHRQGSGHLRLC